MAEIFDKDKFRNGGDFASWALIATLEKFRGDLPEAIMRDPMEIEMRINGVEVTFLRIVARLEEEHDRMLKQAAFELVEEKFGKISALAQQVEDGLKRRLIDDLGLEPEEF